MLGRSEARQRLGVAGEAATREAGDQEIELALWFDLSPVRPWEWASIEADSWTEAIQIRNSYHQGQDDANAEAAMNQRLSKMDAVA